MSTVLNIGPHLVNARRTAGVSQRELAERVGTSQQQIARWEAAGYRSASLERVDAVAEALGVATLSPAAAPPVAAETSATYATPAASSVTTPARDLGEIAARIRMHASEFARHGLSRIGVFGSFALGEQTPTSDVDLLVEFARKPTGLAYMSAPDLAEEILGRAVDWIEPERLRPQLRERVVREVVYVWEA